MGLILISSTVSAQKTTASGADEVILFKPGTGQNSGQSSEYFPKNIFGLPDTSARFQIPQASPDQICSLGFGGEIILGFHNKILRDLPGKDFTIFENAFYAPEFPQMFIEPGRVSVSKDGITYIDFVYDPLTFVGCAGITPTNGDKNPFNPLESGGDSFDLSDIGMDSVRFIKITDIASLLLNRKHPLYDPVTTGFDLDAIVGLHLEELDPISISIGEKGIKINSETESVYSVYTIDGRKVSYIEKPAKNSEIPFETITNGIYGLVVTSSDNRYLKTITFLK
ncbi:MAG: hypothetical protein HYZ54_03370 [Ignavibacteriae bacterium]|nr:hypothetical protein [Ignavibacteriota bacterium]